MQNIVISKKWVAFVSLFLSFLLTSCGEVSTRTAQSDINFPLPGMGDFGFGISVNTEGQPYIYSKDGVPWIDCKTKDCSSKIFKKLEESSKYYEEETGKFPGVAGFSLFRLDLKMGMNGVDGGNKAPEIMDIRFSMFNEAYAGPVKDNHCTVVAYRTNSGQWRIMYDPNDPDCPH